LGVEKQIMPAWICRVAALAAVTLWVAAFFSTYDTFSSHYGSTKSEPATFLKKWGWLGFLQGNLAWYANPLLLWIIFRLARGQLPSLKLSLISLALSLTAFFVFAWDFERDGRIHLTVIYGPAMWLWLAPFIVQAAIVVIGRFVQPRGQTVEDAS
jgi:hypothetical protein